MYGNLLCLNSLLIIVDIINSVSRFVNPLIMKIITPIILVAFFLSTCSPREDQQSNLRSSTYELYRANFNPTSGSVTVTELSPGVLKFHISLKNTDKNNMHPAHLHFGSVREVGEVAFRLNDVDGATGESITILDQASLSNGDLLTYDDFLQMNGSIKVHMNDTYFSKMVLSFGNVGKNEDYFFTGVAVCTGH